MGGGGGGGGGGYVPYTGALQSVNLGEWGLTTGFVSFDTTPTGTPTTVGTMSWNDSDGTADLKLKGGNVTLQIGQEEVLRVVNKTGATLAEADFRAVRIRSVAEGGELFRTNCAMCHNFAAQGGALTQGKYAPTVMGVEPRHIYEAMLTGPQAMPVFSNATITPEEKLSIIKWIKHAENEPALGGAALGRVGPVTEGLLAWTLGLGLLIGVAVWLTTKAR